YPTASGRACPRVADWSVADGAGDGRYRACVTTLLAGNGLTALLFSFLPSCQGAKTPLRHPWAFCAYATVVKATSVSDFRQCAVTWKVLDMRGMAPGPAGEQPVLGQVLDELRAGDNLPLRQRAQDIGPHKALRCLQEGE